MAIRLYSEFKSDNGTQYKIEIHDASWVAAATTFNVDSRGFDLIYEGETDDIVSPIVSSRLTFGAYSENATFETFINTLKTFQENRFQLAVRKYNGASYDLIWAGWITQDLVSVEDESQPYIYEITATDGIGRLSNIDYTTANTISQANGFKATDIIAILKTAFVNIGTSDLWGAGDAFFETSVDWWETNYQTYATSTDPISQHAVDVRLFNEFDDDGNVVYSSTLDILRQIATLYNGRFYMQNGRFVFEQYGNRDTASRYVSRYTKAGTHLGRVLVSDDKTIDQTANAARRSGNGWDFLPATQTAKVHYVQKFLNPFNAFGLFRFRNSTNAYTAGFIAGGSGIQLSIGSTSFNFKVTGSVSTTSPIFPVFKMRIRIQDSSTGTYYYYNRSYNGVAAGGAMFGTPAWSTTSGFYYFDLPPFFTSGVSVVNQPVSIITDDMPVNGELDLQLTLHGVFRSKNGTTYTPSTTPLFDSIFVFGIQTNGSANAPGATFSSNNTTAGIDSKLTLDLGDLFIADGPRQTGHLAVFTGADWVGTSDWRKGSSGASLPILKLLTNETLALHVNPIEQYNGNVITSTLFGQRLVFNSAAYLMTGGTFNASSDEWSGTWYKIESVRANVTALTPVSDLVQKATIATATTSGSSSNDIIGGRIGGMVVDIEDQKIGPFQQTASGARLVGDTEITGTLDVDGTAQFNNDVNITGSVTSTGPLTGEYVQLDTTYNTTPIQGQIVWSQDDGTIDVGLNSNVTMQVGQEEFWLVKNQTGSTIPKGTAVRAAGTLGASGRILGAPMVADGSVPARFFLGIAAEDILNGGDGYVTTFGKIRQLNTSAFTEGSVLWCNPAVAGGLTATEPSAPNLKLAVAFVVRSNATSGVLAVRSEIGARVSDASDVQVTSVADNDLLQYNTSTSRWENVAGTTTNIAEGTNLYYTDARSRAAISETIDGVSYNNTTGVFSLDAGRVIVTTTQTGEWDTAYNDRIVSAAVTGTTSKTLTLTQGDGGTITATWSDYDTAPVTSVNGLTGDVVLTTTNIAEGTNLYYTDARARAALSAGVGISYNNTTGVITNSAPDQVVAITASTAIAVTGAYPNFTIENTAPDQVVAVTAGTGISVTGTYPNFTITNTSPSSGGTITGGGTTNYLSKWTAGTALGDSLVFDNGTNVGIGTTSPAKILTIAASSQTWAGAPQVAFYDTVSGEADARNWTVGAISTNYGNFTIASSTAAGGDPTTPRLTINKDGNVGIGTTSPDRGLTISRSNQYASLNIYKSNTTNQIVYLGTGSSGADDDAILQLFDEATEKVRIFTAGNSWFNGGNVGIGTTSPNSKLNVVGDAATNGLSIKSAGNSSTFPLRVTWSGGADGDMLNVDDDGRTRLNNAPIPTGGGFTNTTLVVKQKADGISGGGLHIEQASTDNVAYFGFTGSVFNIGTSYRVSGSYQPIAFATNGSERLRIANDGNVGIGITNPQTILNVDKNFSAGSTQKDYLRLTASQPGAWFSNVGLQFRWNDYGNGVAWNLGSVEGVVDGWTNPNGGGALAFYTKSFSAYADAPTEKVRITAGGNVGIGTTSPQGLLQIGANSLFDNSDASNAFNLKQTSTTAATGIYLERSGERKGYYIYVGGSADSLTFQRNNSGTKADVMALTRDGNVGIGTTSPLGPLEVYRSNTGGLGGHIIVNNNGSAVGNETALMFGDGAINGIRAAISSTTENSPYYGDIRFKTGASVYSSLTTQMMIKGGGNVLIGTTTDSGDKLRVDGGRFYLTNSVAYSAYIVQNLDTSASTFDETLFLMNSFQSDSGYASIGMSTNGTDGQHHRVTLKAFRDTAGGNVGGQLQIFLREAGTASNVSRVTFRSNGNVGIGTTAPSEKLEVVGNIQTTVSGGDAIVWAKNGTVQSYLVANTTGGIYGLVGTATNHDFLLRTNNTEKMRITSAGNVYINSTSMDGKFGINTASSTAYNPNAYNGNSANIRLTNGSAGAGRYTGIAFGGGGATEAFIGSVQNASELAEVVFQTYNGSAYGERMRITSAGNVGIGTSAPDQLLVVANSTANAESGIIIRNSHANTSADASLRIDGYAGSFIDFYRNTGLRWRFNRVAFSDDFKISASGAGGVGDVMYFDYDTGNVGIGTTAPVTPLQVVSATNAVDVLRIGNTAGNSGSVQAITHLAINHFNAGTNPSTRITAYQDGLSGWPGGMYFSTRSVNTDSAPVERMRITSGGLVGIGTSFPSHILHITDVMRMDNVSAYSPNLSSTSAPKYGYGDVSNDRYLAEPVIWFKINVDGTEYVIPGYTEVI